MRELSERRPYAFFARGRAVFFAGARVDAALLGVRVAGGALVRLRVVRRGAAAGSGRDATASVGGSSIAGAGDASAAS